MHLINWLKKYFLKAQYMLNSVLAVESLGIKRTDLVSSKIIIDATKINGSCEKSRYLILHGQGRGDI